MLIHGQVESCAVTFNYTEPVNDVWLGVVVVVGVVCGRPSCGTVGVCVLNSISMNACSTPVLIWMHIFKGESSRKKGACYDPWQLCDASLCMSVRMSITSV